METFWFSFEKVFILLEKTRTWYECSLLFPFPFYYLYSFGNNRTVVLFSGDWIYFRNISISQFPLNSMTFYHPGADCSEIVGQCSAGICGNGSCIATNAVAFKCHCRQGFSGLYCQYFTDMCSPNPCQNHASCHSNFQSYTCRCPPGYTGTFFKISVILRR